MEKSENLVRLLVSFIPFADLRRPRVLAGEQRRLPTQASAGFYIRMFKFMLDALATRISSRLDVSPNKSKDQLWPSAFGGAGKPSQVSVLSRTVERTWGEGQNVSRPHTQSQHQSRGVNPVSNELGLTLVNPTTRAAGAASQNAISGLLSYTRARISLTHTHSKHTHTQTFSVYAQAGGLQCAVCLVFPTFKQLCWWPGSNVDSWRPVVPENRTSSLSQFIDIYN